MADQSADTNNTDDWPRMRKGAWLRAADNAESHGDLEAAARYRQIAEEFEWPED